MKKYQYVYNISFFHSQGAGCSKIIRDTKIDSLEKFNEVQRLIKEENNLKNVAIINFQLIERKK